MSSARPGTGPPSQFGQDPTRTGPSGGPSDPKLGLGHLVAAASFASTTPTSLTHTSLDTAHAIHPNIHQAGGGHGNPGGADGTGSVVATLKARQPRAGAKRGRKRIQDDDDQHDELSERTGTKRDLDSTLDANEKRKLQNRAAQRAFRERKEQHVKDMEVATVSQAAQLELYYDIIQKLLHEVEALRRGEFVRPSVTELPPPPITAPTMEHDTSATPPPPQALRGHSPLDVKPTLPPALPVQVKLSPPPAETSIAQLAKFAAFDLAPSVPPGLAQAPDRAPYSTMAEMAATLPAPGPVPPYDQHQPPPSDIDMSLLGKDFDGYDDFNAPFDLTSAVPLPPLFNDLFSQSFAPLPASAPPLGTPFGQTSAHDLRTAAVKREAEDEPDEDFCPIDDGEPALLPNGRLPCDKPECDFTSYSCALPLPWRPPSLEGDVRTRDVWVAQVAWAKLVSPPQFGGCDVDELCAELRDRARCSEDGRVVIGKVEACEVFRSIPGRARAARERAGM